MDTSVASRVLARRLIGCPVRWNGIRLGTVTDVILDRPPTGVVGLEVGCPDGLSRFLALPACEVFGSSEVVPVSPLALLDPDSLEYYRAHGIRLSALLDRPIAWDREGRATVVDAELGKNAVVVGLVLAGADGARHMVAPSSLEVDDDPGVVRLTARTSTWGQACQV
jgi:hypothetical protein